MDTWNINGHILEYLDKQHMYLVDGIIVPSITTLIKKKLKGKYDGVNQETLKRASEKGTEMHQIIQDYEEHGIDDVSSTELHNYKFLKKQFKWKCLRNEVPVIIFNDNGKAIAAGRLDMVIEKNEEIGLADLKRTATLDKDYLAYQLNAYRIGYQQCYGTEIKFLKGIHLREDKRKFVDIPINEEKARELLYG